MTEKQVILTTTPASVGATFLDWSILFLSGRDTYYYYPNDQVLPITNSPLTNINAHNYKKNAAGGFDACKKMLNDVKANQQFDFFSMYAFPMQLDDAAHQVNCKVQDIADPSILEKVVTHREDNYAKLIDYALDQSNVDLIYIAVDSNKPLYFLERRTLQRFMTKNAVPESDSDLDDEFNQLFFLEKNNNWGSKDFTYIWDKREWLALNTRPLDVTHRCKKLNLPLNRRHLYINATEWHTFGQDVVEYAMDFCKLAINRHRMIHWILIYNQWKKIHQHRLNFCDQLPHIVDAVVNNWYYPIDLSFKQEVVVQHCLMYQYGLNLKTWNLERFPDNTQKLHKLLEPNIHF